MSTHALIIDHASCWGCRTCEVACKQENDIPAGIRLIKVLENGPHFRDGELDFTYHVRLCRHCDPPACAAVCPEEAISRRQDGLVILDEEQCIGCGLCVDECPDKAIELDGAANVARKCNGCFHRVDKGLYPACADNVCPGHCIYFGDPDEIQKKIAEKHRRSPRASKTASGS